MKTRGLGETISLDLLMFSLAVFTSLLGVALPFLMDEFSLSIADGGLVAGIFNSGCTVGILFSGILIDRYNGRKLILLLAVLYIVMLLVIDSFTVFRFFLILLFFIGVSLKLLDVTLNAQMSELYTLDKASNMHILHFSFGAGALVGPAAMNLIIANGLEWRDGYILLAIVTIAIYVFYIVNVRRKIKVTEGDKRRVMPIASFKSVLKPRIVCLFLVLFLYCSHQMGVNSWIIVFVQDDMHISPLKSGMYLTLFWFGITLGRICCSFVVRHVPEKILLIVSLLLTGGSLFIGLMVGGEIMIMISLVCAGFFGGPTNPAVMTIGYTWYPNAQGKVSMLLYLGIALGGAVFPWLMGAIGEAAGMLTAMLINGCLPIAAAVVILFVPMNIRNEKEIEIIPNGKK